MRISSEADIETGLRHLIETDKRLAAIAPECGPIPLRLAKPGFEGLASIIVSQQVSKASAEAIFGRLKTLIDPLSPENFLHSGEEAWKTAGLSRPKQRTFVAICEAVLSGDLELDGICNVAPEEAMGQLTAVKGIGLWTAEIYLMFCAGHADIFPAGDLALREAIRLGFDMKARPAEKECRQIAEAWAPWRSVAARLLWAYYRVKRHNAAPV